MTKYRILVKLRDNGMTYASRLIDSKDWATRIARLVVGPYRTSSDYNMLDYYFKNSDKITDPFECVWIDSVEEVISVKEGGEPQTD